ncbi:MAG: UDP-glucose/GDP-mannose dehydrogenase family protein [Spirochaetales bacterium]|nr:UDP-glucose/GDP-mannose dehydrogenase family protein [Spirochaetales bacterium]
MKKNIAVFGTGYVGLVTAAGLADIGHNVTAVDIDQRKIKELKKGYLPFYEPGLKKIVKSALTTNKINFTTDSDETVSKNELIIIAVGTPEMSDGRADLSQVRRVFDCITDNMVQKKTIVIKSTVPPGTVDKLREEYAAELDVTNSDIIFCPEFLREGSAVHDFYHPERLVIGCNNLDAAKIVDDIYYPVARKMDVPVLKCSTVSAEMIKYGSNVMLASRLAIINELAEFSEVVGGDIRDVAIGMGLDSRIGKNYMKAGPGFGGSCFEKDIKGIAKAADYHGVNLGLVNEILVSNEHQLVRPAMRLERALGSLKSKNIAVLGLAFKSDTDDVRNSAAFNVVEYLIEKGAKVKVHDPQAEYNFIKDFKKKGYTCADTADDAVKKADAIIILTNWKEYEKITPEFLNNLMKGRVIVDTRNMLDEHSFRDCGFTIYGTGLKELKPYKRNNNCKDLVNAAIVTV